MRKTLIFYFDFIGRLMIFGSVSLDSPDICSEFQMCALPLFRFADYLSFDQLFFFFSGCTNCGEREYVQVALNCFIYCQLNCAMFVPGTTLPPCPDVIVNYGTICCPARAETRAGVPHKLDTWGFVQQIGKSISYFPVPHLCVFHSLWNRWIQSTHTSRTQWWFGSSI